MTNTFDQYILLKTWIENDTLADYLDDSNMAYFMDLSLKDWRQGYMDIFRSIYKFSREFNASYNNYSIIKQLIWSNEHEILSDILSYQNINFENIDLFDRINYGHLNYSTIKLLIEHNFNINMHNGALILRVINFKDYESFMLLVENGADIFVDNGSLFKASVYQFYTLSMRPSDTRIPASRKILEYLIMNGVISKIDKKYSELIIFSGDILMIRLLLEYGLELDFLTTTDLSDIIKMKNIELVNFLIGQGIDFTILNTIELKNVTKDKNKFFDYMLKIGINLDVLVDILDNN